MKGLQFLRSLILLALAFSFASAYDPSPLQDFCVATDEPKNAVFVNGKFCKNPNLTVAEDFSFSGLHIRKDTNNQNGINVTRVSVNEMPGLNTLGISVSRLDYAPNGGFVPPHTHPRGTEILIVTEGTLYAVIITSSPENRLIDKVIYPGDVFVIPMGLLHFQVNIGKTPAVVFAAFNSQNPGFVTITDSMFGSKPLLKPRILAKAFRLDTDIVKHLQEEFSRDN